MNRLPAEPLTEVFMQFIELGEMPPPDSENPSFLSVSDEYLASPMVLGQVCRHWRAVALSTQFETINEP